MGARVRMGAAALVVSLLLTGCDRDRLNQFATFAAAGSAYVATFHSFVAETGDAMVASDSATLVTARAMAGDAVASDKATYRKEVMADDQMLRQYLVDLGRVDRQATLLGKYFEAITELTNGKAQKAAVTSADGLVDAINGLNPEVEKARFGGKSVKDYLGPTTTLVVAHFEVRGLNRDLQKAAPVIDQALSLQEAAVAALTDQMRDSLKASLEVRETTDVIGPYVAKGPLPGDWAEKRAAYVRATVALESAENAKKSVTALHEAFRKLVADKSSTVELKSLLDAISGMSDYATTVRSAQGTAKTN